MSSEFRRVSKRSAGRAKSMVQPTDTYLDLNLLLEMISSSPKKSNLRMRLLLW